MRCASPGMSYLLMGPPPAEHRSCPDSTVDTQRESTQAWFHDVKPTRRDDEDRVCRSDGSGVEIRTTRESLVRADIDKALLQCVDHGLVSAVAEDQPTGRRVLI